MANFLACLLHFLHDTCCWAIVLEDMLPDYRNLGAQQADGIGKPMVVFIF